MKIYKRQHHKRIAQVLSEFNTSYFHEHQILFGGGTRIAMELDEFRESVDIDFFCHTSGAYKAVRKQVTQNSLGDLIKPNQEIKLLREVRADRDAVRTFICSNLDNTPIKLEFIHFDFPVTGEKIAGFDIPVVSKESCYTTKLLANADRYMQSIPKDIFDLCMMKKVWGDIPESSWKAAADCYGEITIVNGLKNALVRFQNNPEQMLKIAIEDLKIEQELAELLVNNIARDFLAEL